MVSFIRLAAVLAPCLPVRGLISNSAGGGAHRLQQGSRQARTPLRAIAGASTDEVREALITSEAFKDLVERLEDRSRQEAGATATSTPVDTWHEQHAFTAAPDRKDAAEHGGGSNDHAKQANHARKRNSEKLAGLRTAVLEVENPVFRAFRLCFRTRAVGDFHERFFCRTAAVQPLTIYFPSLPVCNIRVPDDSPTKQQRQIRRYLAWELDLSCRYKGSGPCKAAPCGGI